MKKIPLPLQILLIGAVLGILFAAFGGYKQLNAKKVNEERYQAAYKQATENVEAANKRLEEIKNELEPLNKQLEAKMQECDSMSMTEAGYFEKHSKCTRESMEIRNKISKLETEQFQIQNDDYDVYYNLVKPMSYIIFYIIGGSVFVAAALAAFIIYLVKGKKTY